MVKYYNGEMCIIPNEFEKEVRADERMKVLDEILKWYKERLNIPRIIMPYTEVIDKIEQMKGEQT